MNETILEEAQRLVYGDRQASYGHPLDDFTKTGKLWTVIFGDLLKPGAFIEAEHVALAMVAVKISRQLNAPKRDNLTDGAGYFGTLELVIEERRRRDAEIVAIVTAGVPDEPE